MNTSINIFNHVKPLDNPPSSPRVAQVFEVVSEFPGWHYIQGKLKEPSTWVLHNYYSSTKEKAACIGGVESYDMYKPLLCHKGLHFCFESIDCVKYLKIEHETTDLILRHVIIPQGALIHFSTAFENNTKMVSSKRKVVNVQDFREAIASWIPKFIVDFIIECDKKTYNQLIRKGVCGLSGRETITLLHSLPGWELGSRGEIYFKNAIINYVKYGKINYQLYALLKCTNKWRILGMGFSSDLDFIKNIINHGPRMLEDRMLSI